MRTAAAVAAVLLLAAGAASALLAAVPGDDGVGGAADAHALPPVVPEQRAPRPPRRRAAVPVPAETAPPAPVPAPVAPERGPWRLTILGPGDRPIRGVVVRRPNEGERIRTGEDGSAVLPWDEDAPSLRVALSGAVPDDVVELVRRDTVLRIGELLDLRVDLVDADSGAAVAGDVGIAERSDAPPRAIEFLGGGSFRIPRVAALPGRRASMTLDITSPPGWARATWRDRWISEDVSPVALSLHRTIALRRETVFEVEVVDPDGHPWTGAVAATVQSGDSWTATVETTGVANVWRLRGAARLRGEPTTIRIEPEGTWGPVTVVVPEDVPEDADGPVRAVLSRDRRSVMRCGGCGGCSIVFADPAPLATTGRARVEVVVRTSDGRPARGVTVRAERSLMRTFPDGSFTIDDQAATKTADAEGRVVFDGVEDGDLEIVAFAAGFAWTSVESVVAAGAPLRIAVTEDPSPAAVVRVLDADGAPVAGARISVERFRDDVWAAVVDGVQHVAPVTGPDGTVRLPKIGQSAVDIEVVFGSREAEARDVAAGDVVEVRLPAAERAD